jgi:hypothetical protein
MYEIFVIVLNFGLKTLIFYGRGRVITQDNDCLMA